MSLRKKFETMRPTVSLNFSIQWLVEKISFIWKNKSLSSCVLAHLKVTGLMPLLLFVMGDIEIYF